MLERLACHYNRATAVHLNQFALPLLLSLCHPCSFSIRTKTELVLCFMHIYCVQPPCSIWHTKFVPSRYLLNSFPQLRSHFEWLLFVHLYEGEILNIEGRWSIFIFVSSQSKILVNITQQFPSTVYCSGKTSCRIHSVKVHNRLEISNLFFTINVSHVRCFIFYAHLYSFQNIHKHWRKKRWRELRVYIFPNSDEKKMGDFLEQTFFRLVGSFAFILFN